jgi:RNA polymerase sigma-70 factor, ECF subfamily
MTHGDFDWDAFYWQQLERIYNYFRYRIADDAVAEDLTSETFEKAIDKWETYDPGKASLTTWLFAIARNTCTDHLRNHRHYLPLEAAENHADGPSIEQIVEQQDDLNQLWYLVRSLDDREREIISLFYGADMTNREIAEVMHISESNVGTTKQRAIEKIRALWRAAQ